MTKADKGTKVAKIAKAVIAATEIPIKAMFCVGVLLSFKSLMPLYYQTKRSLF